MVENHPINYGFSIGSMTQESLLFNGLFILSTSNDQRKGPLLSSPSFIRIFVNIRT